MNLQDLMSFIRWENERLKKHFNYADGDMRIYIRTVKIAEEFGELCNEILALKSEQRKEKLANHDGENLPEEFADVLITTLLLAEHLDVDVEKAIKKKIEKIKTRKY